MKGAFGPCIKKVNGKFKFLRPACTMLKSDWLKFKSVRPARPVLKSDWLIFAVQVPGAV